MATDAGMTELRRGVLGPCVLALLDLRPRFGLEVVRDLGAAGGLLTSDGTVYPLLNRLRDAGLVTSEWRDGRGRAGPAVLLHHRGRPGAAWRRSAPSGRQFSEHRHRRAQSPSTSRPPSPSRPARREEGRPPMTGTALDTTRWSATTCASWTRPSPCCRPARPASCASRSPPTSDEVLEPEASDEEAAEALHRLGSPRELAAEAGAGEAPRGEGGWRRGGRGRSGRGGSGPGVPAPGAHRPGPAEPADLADPRRDGRSQPAP